MKKKKTVFSSRAVRRLRFVEFEIPTLLLKLAADLQDCQQTVIKEEELLYKTTLVKTEDYIKFIFEGDGNNGPSVKLTQDRWQCKIESRGSIESFHTSDAIHKSDQTEKIDADQMKNAASFQTGPTSDIEVRIVVSEETEKNGVSEVEIYKGFVQRSKTSPAGSTTEPSRTDESEQGYCKEEQTGTERRHGHVKYSAVEESGDAEDSAKGSGSVENELKPKLQNSVSSGRHKPGKRKSRDCIKEKMAALGCPGCSKRFENLTRLMYHVTHTHKSQQDYAELNRKLEDLIYEQSARSKSLLVQNCAVCGRERRGITLLNHLAVWHADSDNYDQLMEEAKALYRKNKLAVKLEREKFLFRQETNVCPNCKREFSYRASFRKHVKYACKMNQKGDRQMQCHLCGKQFKQPDHLNRHMREIHQNRYRYHCEKCGHGMAKLSYLKKHKCGRTRRSQALESIWRGQNQSGGGGQAEDDDGSGVIRIEQTLPELGQGGNLLYDSDLFTGPTNNPVMRRDLF